MDAILKKGYDTLHTVYLDTVEVLEAFMVKRDTSSWLNQDVIKWKHFPRYWPFVRGIHRSPVNSRHKRPLTRSFDVFFDLRLNKLLSKQSWGWWFETLSRRLWLGSRMYSVESDIRFLTTHTFNRENNDFNHYDTFFLRVLNMTHRKMPIRYISKSLSANFRYKAFEFFIIYLFKNSNALFRKLALFLFMICGL